MSKSKRSKGKKVKKVVKGLGELYSAIAWNCTGSQSFSYNSTPLSSLLTFLTALSFSLYVF